MAHVEVIDHQSVKGFVMVERVESIGYRARQARLIGKASKDLLNEVLAVLDASLC